MISGPGALLFGQPPISTIGAIVNLVPKRAPEEPLNRLTASYLSRGNVRGTADVARRFGADNAFGVRLNAGVGGGETPVSDNRVEDQVVTAGLDWRGANARVSADFGYQRLNYDRPLQSYGIVAGVPIPSTPPSSVSPRLIAPTPAGVPVMITSPAASVK